jgi:hypothetical protein
MYQERYNNFSESKMLLIENGYDEEDFSGIERKGEFRDYLKLVHSGTLYPSERDPTAFFDAVAALNRTKQISSEKVKIIFRGSGHDSYLGPLIQERQIEHIIQLKPSIPHREALAEIVNADGLLLFQAANCNHQIPAKVYEYLRAGRPILAMTDHTGDTAAVLKSFGIHSIADLCSENEIRTELLEYIEMIKNSSPELKNINSIDRYDRKKETYRLSRVLEEVIEDARKRGD